MESTTITVFVNSLVGQDVVDHERPKPQGDSTFLLLNRTKPRNRHHSPHYLCSSNDAGGGNSTQGINKRRHEILACIAMLQAQKVHLTDFLDERSAYLTQFAEDANAEFDQIGENTLQELDEASAMVSPSLKP
ncbi:hypothetical protein Cni_G22250 [Canna indica]|uniref:Uncharacterized protein n=1 Tax=Canna indica TaxID=4628 RepID=A0AAQ3KRJ5_9LILI|nr:hypothetical protein Cni_G22250 [Canna indica]